MYADLRQDARLCACLEECDRDLAAEARAGGCLVWGCLEWGGPVHAARYARKRRGGEPADLGPGFDRRESFCSARDGCRRRLTPPSLRFLGRKVHLGAVVGASSESALPRAGGVVRTWWGAKRTAWRIFTKPAGSTWSRTRRMNSGGESMTVRPYLIAKRMPVASIA